MINYVFLNFKGYLVSLGLAAVQSQALEAGVAPNLVVAVAPNQALAAVQVLEAVADPSLDHAVDQVRGTVHAVDQARGTVHAVVQYREAEAGRNQARGVDQAAARNQGNAYCRIILSMQVLNVNIKITQSVKVGITQPFSVA